MNEQLPVVGTVQQPPTSLVTRANANELSEIEARLHECEAKVGALKTAFVVAGVALKEINDRQLYVGAYSTFENYCWQRWRFTTRRAYQLIDAAEIATSLMRTVVHTRLVAADVPEIPSERVARALLPLKDRPERLAATWEALGAENAPRTSSTVQLVVEAVKKAPDDQPVTAIVQEALSGPRRSRLESATALDLRTRYGLNGSPVSRLKFALEIIEALPDSDEFSRSNAGKLPIPQERLEHSIRCLMHLRKLYTS